MPNESGLPSAGDGGTGADAAAGARPPRAWVKVARAAEVPPGGKRLVEVGARRILLAHVGGEWRAVKAVCPHRGGDLARGALAGGTIYCPDHAWGFDLTSGACDRGAEWRVAVYPVRVEGDDVLVGI
ncbi:MAG: Rieske (2Fe-2S) protein [Planctomycetes bacterium]|nr:Rieske (2Fe-2S) protein [Planctomycetota bacterium]